MRAYGKESIVMVSHDTSWPTSLNKKLAVDLKISKLLRISQNLLDFVFIFEIENHKIQEKLSSNNGNRKQ